MSTSGTVSLSTSSAIITQDALYVSNAFGLGQPVNAEDTAFATRELNRMIKHYENQGMHIWKRSEGYLIPTPNQNTYTLGSGSTDHICVSYKQYQVVNAATAGAFTLTLTFVTGIVVGDSFGVVQSDGSIFWSTVASINTGAFQVTLNNAITQNVSVGAYIWDYTTSVNKPLEILSVRRRNVSSSIDTQIDMLAYRDYMALPNKSTTSSSPAVNAMFQRNENNSLIYLWPQPADNSYIYPFTYIDSLQDLNNPSDNPDVPQEWYDVLTYGLAVRIAPVYGKMGDQAYKDLKQLADQMLGEALSFDDSATYIDLKPDMLNV